MKELKAKERYLRMFRGESIDRIPVCPRVFENVVFEYNKTRNLGDKYLEKIIEYYRLFGFDIIDWNCTPSPHFEMTDFTMEGPNWKPKIVEEQHGKTKHIIMTVETPKGTLRRVQAISKISPWADESALIEYPIKTEKDFDILAEFMPPPYKLDLSSINKVIKLIGDDGIASPSCHGPFNIIAYCYRRLDDLLLDPLMSPDFYHRMMEYFTNRIMEYTRQMLTTEAPFYDIGTNIAGGIVVSPSFLVEHVLPYDNRLADMIQKKGNIALYHNCGYAANHLCVYDKLHHRAWGYLAPKPHGDTDLDEAIRILPKNMILWGHVDQIDFLRKATPKEIDQRVKWICEKMKPRGNYILGTTDYLETETPVENIRAFVEAGHKHGRYE